jgi:hypothetical protein
MPFEFPDPASQTTYTYGSLTWKWNGSAWEKQSPVLTFNGATGAVQGVCSANGLTGAVLFRTGAGVTYSVSGNGISFSIDYQYGGLSLPVKAYQMGNPSVSPAGVDFLMFQRKGQGGSGEMYLMNIANMFSYFTPIYETPVAYASKISDSTLGSGSTNFKFLMSNSSGSEGTVTFAEQMKVIQSGISFSTQGITGITLALNYRYGGATFAAKSGKPQNADIFLIQEGGTGDMKTVTMSSVVSAFSQSTTDTSATYNASNTNFFIENTSNNNTERVSATTVVNAALTYIDGGNYSIAVP